MCLGRAKGKHLFVYKMANLLTHIKVNKILEGSNLWFLGIYIKKLFRATYFIIVYYHLTIFDITKIILKCISNQNIPCGSRIISILLTDHDWLI